MNVLRLIKIVIVTGLFLVLLTFLMLNRQTIGLKFFFGEGVQLSLVVVLFGVFILGVLAGMLATLSALIRVRRELLQLKRELRTRGNIETPPDAVY